MAAMARSMSPNDLIDEAWAALVRGPGDIQPSRARRVTVTGRPAGQPSNLRVEDAAIACIGVALMAAMALQEQGSGTATPVETTLDRAHVSAAVLSERHFRLSGRPFGTGFAPLSRFWQTADGWVRTHANFPWHKAALLGVLGTPDDTEAVASTLQRWPSKALEERVFEAGGVAAAVRSVEEWLSHPQGSSVSDEPLIDHVAVGDALPRRRDGAGPLPATGIRVLDLTRVIAGPICTRYLGALGADVLRIDPPAYPDMQPGTVADTLLAKRSAGLDLTDASGRAVLHELLDRADVVVLGYRPGALEQFGLGTDELCERHPGLVVVCLSAWGHKGPWAGRRGFDSIVQAATGIARDESPDGTTPGALPCQLLDHGTGYLAATAALDGLRRQGAQGGTHLRHLSLARTAGWLISASDHVTPPGEPVRTPDTTTRFAQPTQLIGGADGSISAINPPGSLGARPLQWPGPPTRYLSDRPSWTT